MCVYVCVRAFIQAVGAQPLSMSPVGSGPGGSWHVAPIAAPRTIMTWRCSAGDRRSYVLFQPPRTTRGHSTTMAVICQEAEVGRQRQRQQG